MQTFGIYFEVSRADIVDFRRLKTNLKLRLNHPFALSVPLTADYTHCFHSPPSIALNMVRRDEPNVP